MVIRSVEQNSGPGLRVIGRIKKGAASTKAAPIGRNLDYFRLDTDDPLLRVVWTEIHGERPQDLQLVLPYSELRQNWDHWLETWGANETLKVRCDGENWVYWLDEKGQPHIEPKRCPWCSGEKPDDPNQHTLTGRLMVVDPQLLDRGFAGALMFITGSWNDVKRIERTMRDLANWAEGGNLAGVPIHLYRAQEQIATQRDGKRIHREEWLALVGPDGTWLRDALSHARMHGETVESAGAADDVEEGEESESEQSYVEPKVKTTVVRGAKVAAPSAESAAQNNERWWEDSKKVSGLVLLAQRFLEFAGLEPNWANLSESERVLEAHALIEDALGSAPAEWLANPPRMTLAQAVNIMWDDIDVRVAGDTEGEEIDYDISEGEFLQMKAFLRERQGDADRSTSGSAIKARAKLIGEWMAAHKKA